MMLLKFRKHNDSVQSGKLSVCRAAEEFGVPKSTLHVHVYVAEC